MSFNSKYSNKKRSDICIVKFATINNDESEFKIDTAAECTVISQRSYDKMNYKPIIKYM